MKHETEKQNEMKLRRHFETHDGDGGQAISVPTSRSVESIIANK